MLVDVDGALVVHEQELLVAEPEHAERLLGCQPLRDDLDVRRLQVRDRDGLLLVQGQDLEAAGGADGERGVEHVERRALGRDVELVEVAEEVGLARAQRREARPLLRRFGQDGLEHLRVRRGAVSGGGGWNRGRTVVTLKVLWIPSRFL